jgi:hypothetical protein
MEAAGNPQQQAAGASRAPPAPEIPSDPPNYDGGTPATPRHTNADNPVMPRPLKRRLLLEADTTEATATGTLLELKEILIEQAKEELQDAMQSMARSMEAAFKEHRQAEEERWERERKKMEEFWKTEARKMLEAMQEGIMMAGRGGALGTGKEENGGVLESGGTQDAGSDAGRDGSRAAPAEDSDEMEVTITGPRTQLDFSKHAVNVHDRDGTPAVQPKNMAKEVQPKTQNVSKHAETQAPPAQRKTPGPPVEIVKADPKPQAAPPKTNVRPLPGLGAVPRPVPTWANIAQAPPKNTSATPARKDGEWNRIGPKGKIQKEPASDGLQPIKRNLNTEDDRKVIFPRDGVTPPPGGSDMAILSEVNRALFAARVSRVCPDMEKSKFKERVRIGGAGFQGLRSSSRSFRN